jgi:tRNA A37 threonylcarbamoyladenosine modification protein TsaB
VDAVFFCAGPGSTLGLRLTLAFIKTVQWEKQTGLSLFSYNALDLAARMSPQKSDFIQAPFRMGWRLVRSKEDGSSIGKKQILKTDDALKNYPDSLHLPDPRKKNLEINPSKILEYEIKKVNGLTDLISVSEEKKQLEVFNPKPPEFKKWYPELTFLKP